MVKGRNEKLYSAERRRMAAAEAMPEEGAGPLADISDKLSSIDDRIAELAGKLQADAGAPAPAVDVGTDLRELRRQMLALQLEVASIRHPHASEDKLSRAKLELEEIVQATEAAANEILDATEQIENSVQAVAADPSATDAIDQLESVQVQAARVYAAANFQDLTGQRITKVLGTVDEMTQRIDRMIAVWGDDAFETLPQPEPLAPKCDEAHLLGGPALENEGLSQDDIDALFD